jgi:hypothetical protein
MDSVRGTESMTCAELRRSVEHMSRERNDLGNGGIEELIKVSKQRRVAVSDWFHPALQPCKVARDELCTGAVKSGGD